MAKVIFIFHWKGKEGERIKSKPVSCSNKRILAEKTKGIPGMGYDNLVRLFTRERRVFWEDSEYIIIKINENDIERGKQKVSNRGRGGKMFNQNNY